MVALLSGWASFFPVDCVPVAAMRRPLVAFSAVRAVRALPAALRSRPAWERGLHDEVGLVVHDLERRADEALDSAKAAALVVIAERVGRAGSSGARRATDAMHVGLGVVGHVEVEDVGDLVDVDAAGRDVGGDEDGHASGLESQEGACADVLALVPVDGPGLDAGVAEGFDEPIGPPLGAREDERAADALVAQEPLQEFRLVLAGDVVDGLGDGRGRGGHGRDLDELGLAEQGVGELSDLARHRGREEEGLAGLGDFLRDASDVVDEAHVEHTVGLVEYEHLNRAQIDVTLLHEVLESAGGGDDDVDTGAERTDLGRLADAAEDRDVSQGEVASVGAEALEDLHGEFARGAEDDGARATIGRDRACAGLSRGRREPAEDGHGEGAGLAGAGLGAAEDVLAGEDHRDGLGLDGGGGGVSLGGDSTNDGLSEPEHLKVHMRVVL